LIKKSTQKIEIEGKEERGREDAKKVHYSVIRRGKNRVYGSHKKIEG